ncbi:MAG: hydrogenase maturation nickel metallochaperone HypA [Deltaproteobacteria bacterium]|nr:hydrogenase maturation nickel metallochaperone HypA [Deltaproteobacteria bacterium]
MHEMGIAMQIIEIAVASIPADLKNAQVKKVNIKVGKLAAVVPESLHFCFQIAAQDTLLCDAELYIEEIPLKVRCMDCNVEWTAHEPIFVCRKCNGTSTEMLSGRELDITSIEVVEKE